MFNNKYFSDTDYNNLFILNNNPFYKLNRKEDGDLKIKMMQ